MVVTTTGIVKQIVQWRVKGVLKSFTDNVLIRHPDMAGTIVRRLDLRRKLGPATLRHVQVHCLNACDTMWWNTCYVIVNGTFRMSRTLFGRCCLALFPTKNLFISKRSFRTFCLLSKIQFKILPIFISKALHILVNRLHPAQVPQSVSIFGGKRT